MRGTYANRGMALEQIIELSNAQYEAKGIALIQKIHTPVKVLKTHKNRRVTGFWEKKSTVDFLGVKGSRAIAFDAKQIQGKNLPLANIGQHQIDFMVKWREQGHEAFLIVWFTDLDLFFRLNIIELIHFKKHNERKSIPLDYFENIATEVTKGEGILLDYLKGVV